MKSNFQLSFGIGLLFLIFAQTNQAQILQTRSEIMETYGSPFCSGTSENDESYLFYKIPVTTENSGTYHQRKVFLFKKSDNGEEICFKWKILEPATETNFNILSFNRNLVQTGEREWKDYGKGIVYKLEEKKGVCKITANFENEADLVKVYKF